MRAAKTARKSRAKPIPPDFPALAPTMTAAELAAHYACSERVVRRWSRESGAGYKAIPNGVPPPDDFRELAPLRTQSELRRIYGRSGFVILRWAKETGAEPRRIRPYVKRDPAREIELCLTCPFSKCRPDACARIKRA